MTTKRLLIYLQSDNLLQASWVVLDETGQIQQSVLRGNIADLSSFVMGYDVCVMIPGEDILLTSAVLPKLNRQRLMQALPFALEEKLIDDVHDLHFAIGEYQSDNTWPVAIITKQKIDAWLHALKQVGISPRAMIPIMLTLPYISGAEALKNWHACIIDDICLIRTGKYSGFTCDKNNLTTFLDLHLAETQIKPECIHLYNFSKESAAVNIDTITMNEINLTDKNFFEHTSEWINENPHINLLQNFYQPKQKTTLTKKIWLMAGFLAIACVALLFLSNTASYFILRHSANTTEQAINKIYKRHFPSATAIVAPRERMEEKLKKASSQANKNYILSLFGMLGNSLNKSTGIRLNNLDFRENLLNLTVTAVSFTNLDAFTQSLKQQGLNVKQQSAAIAGSQVKANLIINKGAS